MLNDYLPDMAPRDCHAGDDSTLVTRANNKNAEETGHNFAKNFTIREDYWKGKIGKIHIAVVCAGKMPDMLRLVEKLVAEVARGNPRAFRGNFFL